MTQLADLRPSGLNFRFRPGSAYTIRLNGPADWLDTRAFTATLGGDALVVSEDGDTLVVTVSDEVTEDHPVSGGTVPWVLTETGGNDVLVGKWEPSENPATSVTTTLELTLATLEVDVTLAVGPSLTGLQVTYGGTIVDA